MAIVLRRIDERLIHGQVVIGWGNQLRLTHYIVVDDDIAGSEWEQDLYRLGLPEEVSTEFCTVDEARRRLPEWRSDGSRSVLLARDPLTMVRLAEGGLMEGEVVNLGGIHAGPGRGMVLPYVYLDGSLRTALRRLREEGIEVWAQDLPGSNRVDLGTLLGTDEPA